MAASSASCPPLPRAAGALTIYFLIRTEEAQRTTGITEERRMLLAEALTERVIGLAIEVHRHTGPGLLESV